MSPSMMSRSYWFFVWMTLSPTLKRTPSSFGLGLMRRWNSSFSALQESAVFSRSGVMTCTSRSGSAW